MYLYLFSFSVNHGERKNERLVEELAKLHHGEPAISGYATFYPSAFTEVVGVAFDRDTNKELLWSVANFLYRNGGAYMKAQWLPAIYQDGTEMKLRTNPPPEPKHPLPIDQF